MIRSPSRLASILALLLAGAGCGDGGGGGGAENDAVFDLAGTFSTSPRPSQNKGMIHFGLFDTSDGRLTARYFSVSEAGYVNDFTEEGSYPVAYAGTAGDRSDPGLFNMNLVAKLVEAETFVPLLWADAHEIGTLEVYESRTLSDYNSLLTIQARPIVEMRIDGDRLFYSYFDESERIQEEALTSTQYQVLGIANDWRRNW